VKALGVGLGFEVKRLNFSLIEALTVESPTVSSSILQVDNKPVTDWFFQECLHDNHCIAVAMVSPANSPVSIVFMYYL